MAVDADAADGTTINRTIDVYDATGASRELELTFTKSATGWSLTATDGTATVNAGAMTFTAAGALTTPTTVTVGGVAVDLSTITGFSGIDSVKARTQNGQAAGVLLVRQRGQEDALFRHAFRLAMSMEKRYFTSLFSMRA